MEEVKVVEINEGLAYEWYARKNNVDLEEVQMYPFFSSLYEVFEYIYTDVNDSYDDVEGTIEMMANTDVNKVIVAGFTTLAEYLAHDWERLAVTPYGYLAVNI